jgi:hypothetical protein
MNNTIKNVIRGVGSAIDISPAPMRGRITTRHNRSISDSLGRDWHKVGKDLWSVVDAERKGDVQAKK